MRFIGESKYSQVMLCSAPSATLQTSFLHLPNLSFGVGLNPERYIFETPTASDVRKIDPTL
jgi:hypothetical protein